MQGFVDAELNRDARSYLYDNGDYYEILSIEKFNPKNKQSTLVRMIKTNKYSPTIIPDSTSFDSDVWSFDSELITFDIL